jgi:hypothetical protein
MAKAVRTALNAVRNNPILRHRAGMVYAAALCSSALNLANACSTNMSRLMPKPGVICISSGVLIGSFFLTLWLTDIGIPGLAVERLAGSQIDNLSDLIEAAVSAGLHRSFQMDGRIESMSRINNGEVAITGWMAEPGEAKPISVLIFVAGKKVATTYTHGERPDVTKVLHAAFDAEQNVRLEANFECASHDRPVIAGLGTSEQYFYLPSPPCP